MVPFRRILVDVDATAPAQPVLEQALELATRLDARLRVVDTTPADPSLLLVPSLHDAWSADRRTRLVRLTTGLRNSRVDANLLVGPTPDVLLDAVRDGDHDLLVRARARDCTTLVRRCPCPVWAVGSGPAREWPRIAVAVDVTRDDDETRQVNTRLVETALAFGRPHRGSLLLMHAWQPPAPVRLAHRTSSRDYAAALHATRRRADRALSALRHAFGLRLAGARVETLHGPIEAVTSRLVLAEDLDLVVVGSPRRGVVARHLFGSTAERLLDRLPCSLVAVPPEEMAAEGRSSLERHACTTTG